ncbi:hypothetical protein D3C75_1026130 [compost metagenome]
MGEAQAPLDAAEQAVEGARREQAGRAAAEEDRPQLAAMGGGQVGVEVGEQGVDVGFFRQFRAGGVGVEVAVRAFAHAPRDVDIQRQRRQLELPGRRHARRAAMVAHAAQARFSRCLSRAMARARWLS